ncbi:MAG: helix-turn-helix domain-containing protein [Candidatus Scatosoma sp.]
MNNAYYNDAYYVECPVKNVLSIRSLYTFFRRKYPRDYSFKGESHDFHEIVCVIGGELGVTADKNVYLLPAGKAIFHRGGEFHSLWSSYNTQSEAVVFSFAADALPPTEKHVFNLSQRQIAEICAIYAAVEKEFVADGYRIISLREGREAEASALIKRLELFVLSLFTQTKETPLHYSARSAENYARIISVLENHLSEDLSAAQIAGLCNLSIPALNKTVARYAGCGVMNYYNTLRLKKAEELLLAGASVKEAALSVGFSNQNYFSACYKKRKGVSPSRVKA